MRRLAFWSAVSPPTSNARTSPLTCSLHSTIADASGKTLLAVHPRAVGHGARIVDDTHWDGLPKGNNRRVTTGDVMPQPRHRNALDEEAGPFKALLNRSAASRIEVSWRPLSVYDELTGNRPFTANSTTKEAR